MPSSQIESVSHFDSRHMNILLYTRENLNILTPSPAVETFVPHLSSIQHLQFDNTNIGSDSIRAVAKFCGSTLRTLRVRECSSITSESCGWMAGAIGHNTPRLRKLQALDIASTQVDDRGLAFLSKGLPRLKYLDLGYCVRLSDRGVGNMISKGSLSYTNILNMRGCKEKCFLNRFMHECQN